MDTTFLARLAGSIVLNEEDEFKTDGSLRDIQMTELVFEALQTQFKATGHMSEYVFCTKSGKPIDSQNFLNRVWVPLLRHLDLAHRRVDQMRHTAATLWLASREAPEWIGHQLGHTSTEMLFRVCSRYVPNLPAETALPWSACSSSNCRSRWSAVWRSPKAVSRRKARREVSRPPKGASTSLCRCSRR